MMLTKISRNNSRISEEGATTSSKNITKLEQDFEVGESLGHGGFGQIIKATRRCDSNEFAIKLIKFESNMEDAGKYRREANNLSRLSHNNIVRYYNSWIETAQIPQAVYESLKANRESSLSSEICALASSGYINNDETEVEFDDDDEDDEVDEDNSSLVSFQSISKEVKFLFIQMELCEKRTLRDAIDENLYLEEDKLTKYFREICEGLSHIHKNGIVHRDLKPENIFLTSEDVIKIGDFGLSKQIAMMDESDYQGFSLDELAIGSLTGVCGTGVYRAPELFHKTFFTIKADMYSLGVIYFEMCSRPMTVMEKYEILPLTSKKIKNMYFLRNSSKKKYLIRNLLHPNGNQRPSCEDILKIMNSQKSLGEIKDILQQQKKVPYQQLKAFDKMLKSKNIQKIDSTNSFMKKAVEIFELHGARNIPGLTFVPSFGNYSDYLTTLLNIRGNSVSVSNTSRVAFVCYVNKHKIKKIRRYSVGKIFDDGYFSPGEEQECVFEAISPDPNDHVTTAEVLYMAQEMCENALGSDRNTVRFYINHRLIFSTVLKHYKIMEEDATIFTNAVLQFANKLSTHLTMPKEWHSRADFTLRVKTCLLKMSTPFNVITAEEEILSKLDVPYEPLVTAFKELKSIVRNLIEFGIKPENIFVSPLLITEKSCSGFMFKVELNFQAVIATGDRFESLIKGNIKRKKNVKYEQLSAIGISFNVENILRICNFGTARVVDVMVYNQDKAKAIPIFKQLLSWKIKCQIINNLSEVFFACIILIIVLDRDECAVFKMTGIVAIELESTTDFFSSETVLQLYRQKVYQGIWKCEDFSKIFLPNLQL